MTPKSISYGTILDCASFDEKIGLCPAGIRGMMREAKSRYAPKDADKLITKCVDIRKAVRSNDGMDVVLNLIDRVCEARGWDAKERIMDYLKISNDSLRGGSLKDYLKRNQGEILRFLKCAEDKSSDEKETDNAEKMEKKPRQVDPTYGLRPYQVTAVHKISQFLESEIPRVMYHAPTGSGKTRTAMSAITCHMRNHGPETVLWLAASAELVDQASESFMAAWKSHGDIRCTLHRWQGSSRHFEPRDQPAANSFVVAGLQKIAAACEQDPGLLDRLRKIVSLIVFDEAHQSVAPTYHHVIEGLMKGGNCRLLGLSATPGRIDEEESRILANIYTRQKVTIERPGGGCPIDYLIEQGYLAKPHFTKITFQDDEEADISCSQHRDYSAGTLNKIGNNMSRNDEIVSIVNKAIEREHSRILVFSPSVNSARVCAAMLQSLYGRTHSCSLSAETPKNARDEILRDYSNKNNGKKNYVIFNYGILTTGFDAPCTSAVIIARPTTSVSMYSQMMGRAIRGTKSGGNKHADIYTVADTSLPQFNNIASAFNNWQSYWEDNTHDQ